MRVQADLPTPGVTPATVVPSAVPESTAPKTPEVPEVPEVPTELTVNSLYIQPVWLAVQNLSRSSYVIHHCLVKQQPARGAQTRSARTLLSLPHHCNNTCVGFSLRKAASSACSRLDVPSMVCTRLHTWQATDSIARNLNFQSTSCTNSLLNSSYRIEAGP